jgi:nicotinamidase/pyrazinamidase
LIYSLSKRDALIIGDVQKDFLPSGALPVPEGDKIIPVLNEYIERFQKAKAKVFATRDWHPPNHISFKPYGGPWPPHCIQGSKGAKFHPDLKLPRNVVVISKARDPMRESYSSFDRTDLEEQLHSGKVKRVFVGGLATDYCVKETILDALKLGFEAMLLTDATLGIDVIKGDVKKAVEEMKSKGAKVSNITSISN